MHRFYLPPEQCQVQRLQLAGREAHHAHHVLRLGPGETVMVLDGVGSRRLCRVETADKEILKLALLEKDSVPMAPCSITLLVAVPKGKIIEDIIEQAVELGVARIVPLLTERVVVKLDQATAAGKHEKWQQVAVEAIKQCGAAWLPAVEAPQPIADYLGRGQAIELALVGSLQGERRHPRDWLSEFRKTHGRLPKSAAVWIGPEGDFSPAEMDTIRAVGAKPVTLGELTLRVKTAALYCLSFLRYEFSR